jgi:alkylation response protein AidB-like acyl-CoA dehydrogenase
MLDFRPDPEQTMLVEAINRLANDKIRKQARNAEEDGTIPPELVQAGWEIGLLPTAIPEAYGGFGDHATITHALATEAFAYGDLAIAMQIMTPNLVAIPLMLSGTDAQKAAYLPQFTSETPPKVTAALTEYTYQFDPRQLATTVTKDGDSYLLNGTKIFVPLADTAELFLVYANENGRTEGFLMPASNLTINHQTPLMGIQALPTHQITLNNVRLPYTAKLGGEAGCDFDTLLNHSRVALGAAAVGVANAAYTYARDYAKQRIQFGRPIAQNQSIAFMLADIASDVESMRLMVWQAATQLDSKTDATRATVLMKNYVDQAVLRVTDAAVQTLGGYGYIREFPVELWLRNARGFTTFDGLMMI